MGTRKASQRRRTERTARPALAVRRQVNTAPGECVRLCEDS
jgi:hypothetical protein